MTAKVCSPKIRLGLKIGYFAPEPPLSFSISRPIVSRSVHKQKAKGKRNFHDSRNCPRDTVGVVLRLQAHTIQPILGEATKRLASFQSLRRANLCSLLIETNLRGLRNQSIYP